MACCLRLHECIRMYSGVCGLRGTCAAPNSLLLVKCAVMHCHRGLANGSVCMYTVVSRLLVPIAICSLHSITRHVINERHSLSFRIQNSNCVSTVRTKSAHAI